MAAVAYGHVAIVPKGIWNADTQYEVCQLVEYDGSSYVAKAQPPVGTLPTDTSYWQVSAAGTKKASSGSLGTGMPDGSTTEVNEEGKLSAKTAQQNALGVVKGSDDITVGEDGNLTVNTTFEQATEIANIIAGEAIKSVLGKVSKAIATTMSLDENALLKNMISGIDVNDGNKVPSSAYIHSLVERIGMGTALEGGFDNLTAGLNSVNNNLSDGLYGTTQDTTLDQLMKHMSDWNHPFVFDIGYTLPIAPDTNNAVGIGERGMLHAFSYSGKHFYCIDASKGWQESPYALKSDLDAVKSKQINRYVSAEKNTDTVLSSYESKEGNFILQFTSNDTTGTIPTLTGSHLFIIEHFMVGNNSDSAIERAYSTKGKLIAWRFKQWWDKTWTAWENS